MLFLHNDVRKFASRSQYKVCGDVRGIHPDTALGNSIINSLINLRNQYRSLCIMQLTVVYVCSLLTLAAVTSRVNTQDVCYHPPVDCQKPGGGSWLQAMQPSTARAQQEATAYACDCCCMTTGCTFSESLCGNPRGCDVSSCYALILGK